jgi:NAD(P)-dependent dehydrogenase (short-subunit alcohol dehydrogenase family)
MFAQTILEGEVAVITGGGTGLGREIAKKMANLGAKIAIASRSSEHLEGGVKELKTITNDVIAIKCDIREPLQVKKLAQQVINHFGQIDILVNNAAGNFIYPAEKMPLMGWKSVIDIVLNGSFYCSQILGNEMIKRKKGTILNILATYAWMGGPGTIHSASAKAGVLAMTRTLAVEWARYNIRVNAIAPGPFDTEGARERLWPTAEIKQKLIDEIPVGRFAKLEEVANSAVFLLTPYAEYITGECLTIDGGAWLGKGIGRAIDFIDQFASLREAGKKGKSN